MAEQDLEIEVIKEITVKKVVSVQTRLERVGYIIGRGVAQRRACTLMSVARSGLVYECNMPVKDRPIIRVMRYYSAQYPRYGARRLRIFLRCDGIVLGQDRATARLWAAAGLQVSFKKPKKRYRSQERQSFVASRSN